MTGLAWVRAAVVGVGLVAAGPASAYWGSPYGYGYGYGGYYPAPPAYYVPFYRPRVLYVPPPVFVPRPVYVQPTVLTPRRVLPRPVHRAAVHVPPPCHCTAPGPAIHATPRLGDLPVQGATPASAGALPWVPRVAAPATPASTTPASTTPASVPAARSQAVTAPPTQTAPAPSVPEPTFTPFTGD